MNLPDTSSTTHGEFPPASSPDAPSGILDRLLVALFAVILLIMTASIFFRYVINYSLSWSDEAVRYLFVWFILLGSSIVLRDHMHIRVEFLVENVSPRLRRIFEFFSDAVVLAFNVVLVLLGTKWFFETSGSYTSTLHWPINVALYAPLPISAVLNIVFLLKKGRKNDPPENDSDGEAIS